MTARSIAAVPVDWQIQLAPGADPQAVIEALAQATGYRKLQPVGYGDAAGFVAHTGGTVQTTGPGKVLGIDPSYLADFPGQIRPLIGAAEGVLLAQQTAANLHATVGDSIAIERAGLPPAEVKVDGIVDLPNADSLFQAVGLPPGLAPQAPPDNVVILPLAHWHALFDPLAAAQPGSVRSQLHVSLAHDRLPPDPAAAYDRVSGRGPQSRGADRRRRDRRRQSRRPIGCGAQRRALCASPVSLPRHAGRAPGHPADPCRRRLRRRTAPAGAVPAAHPRRVDHADPAPRRPRSRSRRRGRDPPRACHRRPRRFAPAWAAISSLLPAWAGSPPPHCSGWRQARPPCSCRPGSRPGS